MALTECLEAQRLLCIILYFYFKNIYKYECDPVKGAGLGGGKGG